MLLHQRAEFRLTLVALAGLLFAAPTHAQIRISQVGKYATTNVNSFDGQYVELFNAGASPVALTGKSIQWASSAGGSGWTKLDLNGSIEPNSYRLIRLSTRYPRSWGIHFVADQERPVLFNGTPAGSTVIGDGAGKVVLADTNTQFTTAGCTAPDAAHVLDLVSWDDDPSTAACHEGSACALIPRLSGIGSTAVTRRCGGQTDTNDNLNDFVDTARPPRNSMWTGDVAGPAVNGITGVTGQSGMGATTGYAGQQVLFSTKPTTCAGSISGATINLSPIAGSSVQTMFDDGTNGDVTGGDGVYSFLYTIPGSAPLGTYTLTISATDSGGLSGTGIAPLTVAPMPPANDLCVNAEVIPATGLPVSVSAAGNLVSASPITQINTSCTTGTGTSRDVWYSFTPVVSGNYTITTCNSVTYQGITSGMSTNLTIFTTCPDENATDLTGLSLACNTNGCGVFVGGGPSTISLFAMDAGTTYFIRVAKAGSGDGIFGSPFRLDITSEAFGACCLPNGLCITTNESGCASASGTFGGDGTTCSNFTCPPAPPPDNNDCSAATELSSGVPVNGVTYGATGSDISTCDNTSWDVWYSYTPVATGPFRIDVALTSGSQTPAIAIFATCPPVTDANLACSGTPATGNSNSLTFSGTSATPYFIRVATNFSQRSEFTVVVTPVCAPDFNNDGVVDFFDYLDFVDAFSSNLPAADFNNDSVIDFFDYLDFVDAFSIGC